MVVKQICPRSKYIIILPLYQADVKITCQSRYSKIQSWLMLKILRKKGIAKKLIWGVAILIIISFGFLGTAYLIADSGSSNYAGKIFNKKVSIEDFDKIYQHVRIQAMMQHGDNFNNIRQFLNLEAETWDRLILIKEANRRKITATDEEVVQAIEQYEFFKRNGQFDTLLYNDILRFVFRIEPRNFEEGTRDNVRFLKLFQEVTNSAVVSEEDIRETYIKQNEKIQVSYAFLSPDTFINQVTFNPDKALAYYETNKESFLVPPMINVQYMTLKFPEDTQESDEDNRKLAKEVLRNQAAAIYQALSTNPDMKSVAATHQLEVKQSGYFSEEQPNLNLGWSYDLLKGIFQLPVNQTIAPFETTDGIYIVKVSDKKAAHIPTYEDAKEKVQQALIKQEAKMIAATKAAVYLQQIKESYNNSPLKDFGNIVKEAGLDLNQTPNFIRGQYLPKIGLSKEFQDAAFELTEDNKMSDVVEIPAGFCILHLDTSVPIDEEQYLKQKDKFSQTLLQDQRSEIFSDFLSALRVKANLEDNLSKLRQQ